MLLCWMSWRPNMVCNCPLSKLWFDSSHRRKSHFKIRHLFLKKIKFKTYTEKQLILKSSLYWKTAYTEKQLILKSSLYWKAADTEKQPILKSSLHWKAAYAEKQLILKSSLCKGLKHWRFAQHSQYHIAFTRWNTEKQPILKALSIDGLPNIPSIT